MPRLPVMAAYSALRLGELALGGRDLLLRAVWYLLNQLRDGGHIDDGELRVRGPDAPTARSGDPAE